MSGPMGRGRVEVAVTEPSAEVRRESLNIDKRRSSLLITGSVSEPLRNVFMSCRGRTRAEASRGQPGLSRGRQGPW